MLMWASQAIRRGCAPVAQDRIHMTMGDLGGDRITSRRGWRFSTVAQRHEECQQHVCREEHIGIRMSV